MWKNDDKPARQTEADRSDAKRAIQLLLDSRIESSFAVFGSEAAGKMRTSRLKDTFGDGE